MRRRKSNPLLKRVPREFVGEWRKYLVIFLFLTLTIGYVAGMYVANYSMIQSFEDGKSKYQLEDGHFELSERADEELLAAIASGEKIDLRTYYIEESHREIDDKLEEEVQKEAKKQIEDEIDAAIGQQIMYGLLSEDDSDSARQEMFDQAWDEFLKSDEYKDIVTEARKTAYEDAEKEINDKFDEQEEKKTETQKKQEAEFTPVTVTLYENFYKDCTEVHTLGGKIDGNTDGKNGGKTDGNMDEKTDGTVRLFTVREDSNLACIMEGHLPANETEIAIDRMHADNNELHVGDSIRIGGEDFTISGLLALVNYSTLYEHNTDSMFDALTFDVAWVTQEGFERVTSRTHYCYAWNYVEQPKDEAQEKKRSDFFLSALVTQTVKAENDLEDYVPRYANQAINFAPDDMGSDESMGGVLLYILVIVLGFIFAITISSTIVKEASVIGTLRASGYTKRELILHYMTMPVLVTLLSAMIGNVLGYTFFKNTVVAMYYNSYSLPTYETVWYYEAFVKTTLVPLIIMLLINYIVIRKKLNLSPLRFLRHDLKNSKRRKAIRLPKVKFLSRFRMRVMLQNLPNYLVLIVGMFFVMLLLDFAFGLPSTLKYYQENAVDQMFAKYQYVLKQTEDEDGNAIATSVPGAEKYSVSELLTADGVRVGENVMVYGVEKDSDYIRLGVSPAEGEVVISSSFADKFSLNRGDEITLSEKYTGEKYHFTIIDIYDYLGGVTAFLSMDEFNQTFDRTEDSFNGYLSDEELTDISEKYVATKITEEDITKISRQLDHSMGSYMDYFKVACLIFAAILIYLLTKVIIEHNANAISMVKILGYQTGEIASLYLVTTTWVVLFAAAAGAFFGKWGLEILWRAIMNDMDGWLPIFINPMSYAGMIALVFAAYLVILLIDFYRIKRVPMDEALKNVE